MGRGGPSPELHSCRPPASLLARPVLGSIFLHTCMIILGQLAALFTTKSQEWCAALPAVLTSQGWKGKMTIPRFCSYCRYIPLNFTWTEDENLPNMENSSVFVLSGFQYIILAVVVTKSYPHKKPLYYNCERPSKSPRSEALSALIFTLWDLCCSAGIFFCLLLLLFAVMTWLVIYPGAFVADALQLYDFTDMEFKVLLLALAALNFFLCFIFEVSCDKVTLLERINEKSMSSCTWTLTWYFLRHSLCHSDFILNNWTFKSGCENIDCLLYVLIPL